MKLNNLNAEISTKTLKIKDTFWKRKGLSQLSGIEPISKDLNVRLLKKNQIMLKIDFQQSKR